MFLAWSGEVVFPARQRMLALLWLACQRGGLLVADQCGRAPGTLLAAMLMPIPVVQISTPNCALPDTTFSATACA